MTLQRITANGLAVVLVMSILASAAPPQVAAQSGGIATRVSVAINGTEADLH